MSDQTEEADQRIRLIWDQDEGSYLFAIDDGSNMVSFRMQENEAIAMASVILARHELNGEPQ